MSIGFERATCGQIAVVTTAAWAVDLLAEPVGPEPMRPAGSTTIAAARTWLYDVVVIVDDAVVR